MIAVDPSPEVINMSGDGLNIETVRAPIGGKGEPG
jgi:hypothetical protein